MHGAKHKGSPPTEPFGEIMGKAEAALAEGDHVQAERLFGQATVAQPASASAWHGKGRAFVAQKAWDKALRCFSVAVKFDPKHADAFAARAEVWQHLGDAAKARADVEALAGLDPGHAELGRLRGLVG
ncbi:MAG TPA: tetratricopeptide repeat protein [Candidatus Thermoplasmatota archaeon]